MTTPTDPRAVVEAFLDALADPDLERAAELLADDVVYSNMGLPTLHGRDRVVRALSIMDRPRASFEVYVHAIAVNDGTVLTERTDVLAYGRFRAQFWVSGRFDVQDGMISLWRDAFDFVDISRAAVRGLLALAVPRATPSRPVWPGAVPGRHRSPGSAERRALVRSRAAANRS